MERSEESSKIIDGLASLSHKLRHHIIYFEDPVGKTEYVPNDKFENNIRRLMDVLHHEDVYIVITMREGIYNKFRPLGKTDIPKFVKQLNIQQRSYNYDKRKEMLLRWAEAMNCGWLKDEKLKNAVLQSIESETMLPTPLNIKDFVMATSNKHYITSKQELLDIMNAKSKETAEVFAKEVKDMTKEKILLLSFPFISDLFSVDFIKREYEEMLDIIGIEKDEWLFKKVRDFKDDKIAISGQYLRFAHPSYSEALQFLLLEDDEIPTEINTEIFSKVLFKLADYEETAWDVSIFIEYNFDNLTSDFRNKLLLKLADHSAAESALVSIIRHNFNNIKDNVRNKLLLDMGDKAIMGSAMNIAETISCNYDKLPENVRNLLFKMSDEGNSPDAIPETISCNERIMKNHLGILLFL